MEELITEEFISYKTGFIAGKQKVVEMFKLVKQLDLNTVEDIETQKDWYLYGELDGTEYFSEKFMLPNFDLATVNTKEVVKEKFVERVMKINQNEASSIPIGKFRV